MTRLLWCDTETTGLDPETGLLLEVAFVVTDVETLTPQEVYTTPIAVDMRAALPLCDEKVRKMHTDNGLFREILEGKGKPIEQVREEACAFIRKQALDKPPMCGSNPSFDMGWLKRHMSETAKLIGHRNFDTRTLYLAAAWFDLGTYKAIKGVERESNHRAMGDAAACIRLTKAFRKAVGWAQ